MDCSTLILIIALFAIFVFACRCYKSSFSALADSQNPINILYNQPAQNRSGGPNPSWPVTFPNPVEQNIEVLPYTNQGNVIPTVADIKIAQGTYPYNIETDNGSPAVGLRETFVTDGPLLDSSNLHGSWPQEPFQSLPYVDPISANGNLNSGLLGVYDRNYVNPYPFYGQQADAVVIPGTGPIENFVSKKKNLLV